MRVAGAEVTEQRLSAFRFLYFRHCERSEAIQRFNRKVWIASSLRSSQ
jgi:hypothetical protein